MVERNAKEFAQEIKKILNILREPYDIWRIKKEEDVLEFMIELRSKFFNHIQKGDHKNENLLESYKVALSERKWEMSKLLPGQCESVFSIQFQENNY